MSDEAEAALEETIDKLIDSINRLANELKRYNDNAVMNKLARKGK